MLSNFLFPRWKTIYDELKILKIRDIYLVHQFLFRFHHNLLSSMFDEYFVGHGVFHACVTRNAHLYRLPTFKKSSGRGSISYCGVKVCEQILNCKIDIDTPQPVFKVTTTTTAKKKKKKCEKVFTKSGNSC